MKKLEKIFAVVALAGAGLLASCNFPERPGPNEAEADNVADFVKKHAVTLPPEMAKVPPGIYSDVEVKTPEGTEICKVSVSEDKSHARTRQVVLSDCRCQP